MLAGILIVVLLSESGREAKDELGTFELIDPFSNNGLAECVFSFRDKADGAGGSAQAGGFVAIFGESFFAISGDFKAIFADKNQCRHTLAAIDANGGGKIGRGGIAVNKSQVNQAGGCGFDNVLKDGALAGTVAAPGAREAKHAMRRVKRARRFFWSVPREMASALACQRR